MATIDTSIYQSLLRPPKSVMEYDAEAMGNQQNRLALQLQQGQLAAQQAGVARTNRLATVLGGFKPGLSAAEQGDALTRSGFIDEGRKVVESGAKANKDMREGEKAQREAEKFQFEQARDQIGFVNQIIGSAKDQASYTQGRQAMAARGLDVSQIPEQFDPAYVQSAGAQTLTQLQRIDDAWKAKGFDLDMQKFGEDKRSNKAREGLTAAGLAQSDRQFNVREARERATPRGVVVQGDAGPLLVDPRSGESKPVTMNGEAVGPKLKQIPATVSKAILENKASLRTVDRALQELEKYPAAFGAKNYLGDGIRQRTDPEGITARAYTADIGSLLIHDRSGAAVTASETPRLLPFIPQATDNPATVKKKLTRFKEEYEAINADINATYSKEQGFRAGGGAAKTSGIDALLEKYGD